MEPFTRRLLSLPGGIHFRKLTLKWLYEEDLLTATALVEECSHTLESLDITWSSSVSPFGICVRTDNLLLFLGEPVLSFGRPFESDKTRRM
jgi:hypothetical protein